MPKASKFKLSAKSMARMKGIDARLIAIMQLAITITVIDFGIPEFGGLRTTAEQKALFEKGVSKADGVKKRSKHQDGKAVDFYAYVTDADGKNGHASWEIGDLAYVAAAILQAACQLGHKIEWGGLWPWDAPHIQLTD